MAQLDPGRYRKLGAIGIYGQSDGLYYDTTNSRLVMALGDAIVDIITAEGSTADLEITSEARGDILRRNASSWGRLSAKDSGKVLLGDGTDVISAAVSGDATIGADGALTVTDVTVGSDATGDILYKSSATALARRAIGAIGRVLTVDAGTTLPKWDTGKTVSENLKNYATAVQLSLHQSDSTAFDGSTGVHNVLHGVNLSLNAFPLGAGQTLPPAIVADGLDIGGDQVDNEGYELNSHCGFASGQRPFVIGQDPAFYFLAKLKVTTINGCDVLAVGFRRAFGSNSELLVRADLNDYLDFAGIGLTTAATPGALKIQTALNNGATTVTDTTNTIASATELQIKVLVSAAGVVTYQHDAVTPGTLAAPTATAAFTFDDGDPVVPWFHFLNANAAQCGAMIVQHWEAGYQ